MLVIVTKIGGDLMVDYTEAIKRPFSDLNKLLIYIVISIIPIVNFISSGYLLDVAQTAMNRKKKLPEFKDYGRLFVEGLKLLVIALVYAIPVIIIAVLFMAGFSTNLNIGSMGIGFMIIIGILAILTVYFESGAVLMYADTRKLGEAFNFGEISKKVFTGKFFGGWLISLIISAAIGLAIGFALFFIPLLGRILASAIGGIFYMSAMGEVYSEA